jgi:hypothetical protein
MLWAWRRPSTHAAPATSLAPAATLLPWPAAPAPVAGPGTPVARGWARHAAIAVRRGPLHAASTAAAAAAWRLLLPLHPATTAAAAAVLALLLWVVALLLARLARCGLAGAVQAQDVVRQVRCRGAAAAKGCAASWRRPNIPAPVAGAAARPRRAAAARRPPASAALLLLGRAEGAVVCATALKGLGGDGGAHGPHRDAWPPARLLLVLVLLLLLRLLLLQEGVVRPRRAPGAERRLRAALLESLLRAVARAGAT